MAETPFGAARTPRELQRDLAEEIADDAADLFAWVAQRGTLDVHDDPKQNGLGPQFDEILGRLKAKVDMLAAARWVLSVKEADRLDTRRQAP